MKKTKKDDLTVNSTIVFILTTIGSGINYLCQILMGRLFSVENYGIINTIFSLTLIITVVGNTAFMLLSKSIAKKSKNRYAQYKYILKLVNISSVVICFLSVIMYPILNKLLGKDIITIILTVICLITSIYPILYQGVFGGVNKFAKLGLYTLIIPIIKVIGLLLVALLDIHGALELYFVIISIIFGNIIAIVIAMLASKKYLIKDSKKEIDNLKIRNEYLGILVVNCLLMFLMNLDVLSLNYFYDTNTVGLYSSVLVFGKMIYYFVTALVTVMLPMISKNEKNKEYATKMLYRTLIYTAILTIIVLIPTNIFAKNILQIIFGNKYNGAYQYMKYASIICLSYSLNMIVLNFLVGINKTKFIKNTFIVGILIAVILLIIFNNNQYISLLIIAGVNLVIFISNITNIYFREVRSNEQKGRKTVSRNALL